MKKKKRRIDYKKVEDKFFKQIIPGINRLLDKLGIPHKIVRILPQEFLNYGEKTKIMDLSGLIDADECPINIEFKSNYPSEEEIRNTLEYAFYLSSKYGKRVYSYIISTYPYLKKERFHDIEWHNNDKYVIPVYTIKDFDAEETRSRIQKKLDDEDAYISDEDLTDITVLTFMDSPKEPKELLIEAIHLINQVNESNSKGINRDSINSVKCLLILLTEKFADSFEERKELMGMIKMESGMIYGAIETIKQIGADEKREEIFKEGRKEGKLEGIKIGEKKVNEIAKKLLKKGYPLNEISEVTNLNMNEIKQLNKV